MIFFLGFHHSAYASITKVHTYYFLPRYEIKIELMNHLLLDKPEARGWHLDGQGLGSSERSGDPRPTLRQLAEFREAFASSVISAQEETLSGAEQNAAFLPGRSSA
jgi:hypothetical protein